MNKDRIIKEADYYLENEGTIKDVGEHFGLSKKTIQIDFKKLEEIDPDKYKLVQAKKIGNMAAGAVKGGQNGVPSAPRSGIQRKPYTLTNTNLKIIAKDIIDNDLTLRKAEKKYGVSKSTIHDSLSRLDKDTFRSVKIIQEKHSRR